jgi:hypothetical protein
MCLGWVSSFEQRSSVELTAQFFAESAPRRLPHAAHWTHHQVSVLLAEKRCLLFLEVVT